MTKPFRLTEGGSRIDRSKRITFSFDGRDVTGFAGDTVASAVLASGQKLFGRSFKYHRPRGVVGLGSEEMNALIGVGADAQHEPNSRATQVEVFHGLVCVSQNRWPALRYDIGAAETAALAGAKVLLCDENSELGGIADLTAGMINGECVADWLAPLVARLT